MRLCSKGLEKAELVAGMRCRGKDTNQRKSRFALARIMHETPSRDRGGGRATGQPQGLGPEAYFFSTSQGTRPEDARKDGQIRGRSRWLVHNAGYATRPPGSNLLPMLTTSSTE